MSNFIIKSLDFYNDKNFEKVSGTRNVYPNYVKYNYLSKLGECEIIVTDTEIFIKRTGENVSSLEIKLNEYRDFYYKNDVMNKVFKVIGKSISYDEDKKILNFIYKLYDGDNFLNEINFSIKEL